MKNPPAEATVATLLSWGRAVLARGRGTAEGREAVLLLRRVLGVDESRLRAHPEWVVSSAQARDFSRLIRRRSDGEPAAYLLAEREFYGRLFHVNPAVLIPRPETELLIDLALESALPAQPWVLDLGTGSGCLAVTLALEIDGARVGAVDVSIAALTVAAANAHRHGVGERVRPVAADCTSAVDLSCFDLLIANPPYLTETEWNATDPEIRDHEPRSALVAGGRGLAFYRRLQKSLHGLRPGCRVILETGGGRANVVADLCREELEDVAIHRDLAGMDRAVIGRRSTSAAGPARPASG